MITHGTHVPHGDYHSTLEHVPGWAMALVLILLALLLSGMERF